MNQFRVSKEYLTNWLKADTNHINNQHIYMNAATAKIVLKSVGQGTENLNVMNDLQFFDFTQGLDALLANTDVFP